MMAAKTRFQPDEIFIAWQGAAAELEGGQYAVSRGDRLRASHPLVKHMGAAAFVPDGTPEREWPGVHDAAIAAANEAQAEPAPAASAPRIAGSTRLDQLVVCSQGILSSTAGRCREGSVYLATDALPVAVPEAFVSLSERLDA